MSHNVDGTARLLEHTEEPCPVCELRHAVELSYRCVGCDRGVCAACAVFVRATAEIFCPACRDESAAEP